MAEEIILALSTFPDLPTAQSIGRVLVEEQLAACVNLLPNVQSIYRWEGKVEEAQEIVAVIKTTIGRYQTMENRIKGLHPYQVPEIIALSPTGGLPDYLNWVVQSCNR